MSIIELFECAWHPFLKDLGKNVGIAEKTIIVENGKRIAPCAAAQRLSILLRSRQKK